MIVPTLIMAGLAVALLVVGYVSGGNRHIAGIKAGGTLLLQVFPLLIFAFILAGMIQVLMPRELISRWIGAESGLRGIMVGSIVGMFAPGGPFVSFPIVAVMLKGGSGIGPMAAFLTSWSLVGIHRLPMEVSIIGWRFTIIRLASTFFLPPVVGMLAQLLSGKIGS